MCVFGAAANATGFKSPAQCLQEATQSLFNFRNAEAEIPTHLYERTADRTMTEIHEFINNPGLNEFLKNTKPEQVLFDSGGGYSIYGLELANRGVKVHVTSPQNFYETLFQFSDPERLKQLFGSRLKLTSNDFSYNTYWGGKQKVGSIRVSTLKSIGDAVGIPVPERLRNTVWQNSSAMNTISSVEAMPLLQEYLDKVIAKVKSLETSGHFVRHTKTTQEAFRNIHTFDRFLDINGAYFYSSNRMALLRETYSRLPEGGEAMLVSEGMWDVVHLENGDKVSLFSYLAQKFPDHFEFLPSGPRPYGGYNAFSAMRMKKTPGQKWIDLESKIEATEIEDAVTFQRIHYKPISK